MNHLFRFGRTVSVLKPSQVFWRLRYRLIRKLEASSLYDVSRSVGREISACGLDFTRVPTPIDTTTSSTAKRTLSELRSGRLTLLNQTMAWPENDRWFMQGGREQDRLWKYTLHYHGWIADLARGFVAEQDEEYLRQIESHLESWLSDCRLGEPGFSHYPWNSYAIATRLDQWRQLVCLLPDSFWQERTQLQKQFARSVAAQAAYLHSHIEWDLRANHLMRDALGLACAGRMLEGELPCKWLAAAAKIIRSQLVEQVLKDGGHFERSMMYHLEMMHDLLKLSSLVDNATAGVIRETWARMAEYAAWFQHSDGSSFQHNDGSVTVPRSTLEMGTLLGIDLDLTQRSGCHWFRESGLVVWRGDPWTIFFDAGEVGPTYQPGHAHADTLMVECSYREHRLFIDPGTHSYDHDERRRYDRATRSHNTVCIDGQDSSEVWHIFRVGRRARPLDVKVQAGDDHFEATGAHDGYDHLHGSPRHRRTIKLASTNTLEISDDVTSRPDLETDHEVAGGFLVDPVWEIEQATQGWRLTCADEVVDVELQCDRTLELSTASVYAHPQYGIETVAMRIEWSYTGSLPLKVCIRISGRSHR